MVAILRILFTTAAVLFASLPVLANPAPAIVPASLEAIHKLTKRQSSATTPKVDLNKLPEECKPVCKETNDKFSGCTTDQCICKDPILESFGACMTCSSSHPNALMDQKTAQNGIDLLTGLCNKEGFKVKSVKIGSGSNNGAAWGSPSIGALAMVALGAVLAQA